jgi:poly(hydroxyalkanoate) depolymerase family esterase
MLRASVRLQRALSNAWAQSSAPVEAGAGEAIGPGRFVGGTFRNAAGLRHYKLYAPAASRKPLPLVVMLHGCAQDPDDFAAGTRMNLLAEELGFVVLYPAQSRRANHGRCWNWFEALHQRRGEGEPSLIAGMTRKIVRSGLDARRVYVAGLSAGGAMAAVMAAEYPDLYAAVGIHSGLPHRIAHDLPSAIAAMNGSRSGLHDLVGADATLSVPMIAFHGDLDSTVHPSNSGFARVSGARVAEERGAQNGRSYTRTVHLDSSGRPAAEQWLVHGTAHAWSGGDPRGSFTDPYGPDASREMLRFFLLHRRPERQSQEKR